MRSGLGGLLGITVDPDGSGRGSNPEFFDLKRHRKQSFRGELGVRPRIITLETTGAFCAKGVLNEPSEKTNELERATILQACADRQLEHKPSLESLGVMLGSDADVAAHCASAVDKHEAALRCLRHPEMPVQVALQLLRYCALPRLSFLARTTPPEQLRSSAERFDELLLQTFLHILQLSPECIRKQPVTEEQLRAQISLPLSKGGMGLRPAARISPSAYFASAAAILPDFLRAFPSLDSAAFIDTELCGQLEECRQWMRAQGVTSGASEEPTVTAEGAPANDEAAGEKSPLHSPSKRGRSPRKTATPRCNAKKKPKGLHVSAAADSTLGASSQSADTVLPAALQCNSFELWTLATEHLRSCSNEDNSGFLQAQHVQHAATERIEQHEYDKLHAQSSLRRQVLLTSGRAKHSSIFLSTLPTAPCYRMSDASVRLAIRHRLGLLPYESLARTKCICRFNTRFADDPDHFHSCDKFKKSVLNQRHNNLVQVLQDLAVNAGFIAIREPNSHIRPADIASLPVQSEEYNKHADLLLLRHGQKLYIDVTVTRPTSETNIKSRGRAVAHTPLVSTKGAASNKHWKYDSIASTNSYKMIPFVLETYGGLGAEATALLQQLSFSAHDYTPSEFLLHARRRLSVTLQSSNADVAQLAMQRFHLIQHASNRGTYQHSLQLADERNKRYAQPHNGDRLATKIRGVVAEAEARASFVDELACLDDEHESAPFVHSHRVSFADLPARSVDFAGRVTLAA